MREYTLIVNEDYTRTVTVQAKNRDEAWARLQWTRLYMESGATESMKIVVSSTPND